MDNLTDLVKKYKEVNFSRVYNFSGAWDSYEDYASHLEGRKARLGIASLDNALGLIRPSQVVTFIGDTNIGKTALAMNTVFSNANYFKDGLVILIECEIDQNEIFERAIQMEYDLYTYEVEKAFKENNTEQFKPIIKKYSNVISLIYRINADELIPYIKAIEELYNKPCRLLGIDYVGLVRNRHEDEYQKITYSMQKLKETALIIQCPVINFSQVPRADIKNKKEHLTLHSAKGSGEVENSSQIVITLDLITDEGTAQMLGVSEMLEGDKPTHRLIKATIHKKKQGEYGSTYLLFNKKNLRFQDLKKAQIF
jgi:replicative DNA helicase